MTSWQSRRSGGAANYNFKVFGQNRFEVQSNLRGTTTADESWVTIWCYDFFTLMLWLNFRILAAAPALLLWLNGNCYDFRPGSVSDTGLFVKSQKWSSDPDCIRFALRETEGPKIVLDHLTLTVSGLNCWFTPEPPPNHPQIHKINQIEGFEPWDPSHEKERTKKTESWHRELLRPSGRRVMAKLLCLGLEFWFLRGVGLIAPKPDTVRGHDPGKWKFGDSEDCEIRLLIILPWLYQFPNLI